MLDIHGTQPKSKIRTCGTDDSPTPLTILSPLTRCKMRLQLAALEQEPQSRSVAARWRLWRYSADRIARALPIRWRILTLAALNISVVLILAALIWNGAKVL